MTEAIKLVMEGKESDLPCTISEAMFYMRAGTELDFFAAAMGGKRFFITPISSEQKSDYLHCRYEFMHLAVSDSPDTANHLG